MNWLIIFLVCQLSCIADSFTIPNFLENEVKDLHSTTENPVETKNCTQMELYCESCTNLVMCVDSDYGFIKQQVTCPIGTNCLVDKCTTDRNPLCDGTASVPFQCHVTGIFPDPFDCRKYHVCVPKSNKIVDHQMDLIHYMLQCQNDGNTEYRFDAKTTYCKYKLEKGCPKWPVPFCDVEGKTGALDENQSIFYVCDSVDGHLYPQLYVCPHGENYNTGSGQCAFAEEKIDKPTTASPRKMNRWGNYDYN